MNYLALKIAFQNLVSRKNPSWMSILGLAIAFTSVLYIYSYISFELGYDAHHKKAERIYRLNGDLIAAENTMTHALIGPSLGPQLQEEFPAVEAFVRMSPIRQAVRLHKDKEQFIVKEAYRTDSTIFDIFSFEFLYGNKASALNQSNQIVINESLSLKMFGTSNPVGNLIKHNDELFTVCAVIKDSPENSHHKLNVLFSNYRRQREGLSEVQKSEGFWMPSTYLFVLLKPNTKVESILDHFDPFFETHMAKFGKAINARFQLVPTPLKDLHFSRHMSYDYPKGNRTYSYILIGIAIFILLIACINYSNLLISQNNTQSISMGVRKVFGASKKDLFIQYLLNSLVMVFSSLILALLLFTVSLPQIEKLTNINASAFSAGNILVVSIGLVLTTVLLTSAFAYFNRLAQSGLHLGTSKPTSLVRKGRMQFGKLSTIIQYALSTILLISVLIITRQINFLLKHDMGFDQENIVLLKIDGTEKIETYESFKNELRRNSQFLKVASSSHVPGEVLQSIHFQIPRDGQKVTKIFNGMGVDYDYISLMGMEIKEGRGFRMDLNDDQYRSAVVNEAFVEYCGFQDSIIGRKLEQTTIIGVLKDACFNSLHNPNEPLIMYIDDLTKGYINIKINPLSDTDEVLHSIKKIWNQFFGATPMDYQFLDTRIAMLYEEDQKKNTLFQLFTAVSLIITIMGLLNISLLIMQRKTKEIGIRKVNGAKTPEIMAMLNKNILKWVAIAFVVACPIAYYFMNKWLENFAYKTEISWWIFALTGLVTLSITLLMVSFQTWRAATRNPVESLRYE
ncbi:MAG: ABC transporter permease [Marinifilaceae bacterium]